MCEPMTIATVGAMAVGTAVSLYGKEQEGNYQARMAANNAKIQGWQQTGALQEGANQAAAIRSQGAAVGGAARSAVAANGVEGTTGSAANLFETNAINTEVDAARAKANAARAAWGFANEQQDMTAQAGMIRRGTMLGGLGQGIGAMGQMAQTGYGMYKQFG